MIIGYLDPWGRLCVVLKKRFNISFLLFRGKHRSKRPCVEAAQCVSEHSGLLGLGIWRIMGLSK